MELGRLRRVLSIEVGGRVDTFCNNFKGTDARASDKMNGVHKAIRRGRS
jgi:hypothetical protein